MSLPPELVAQRRAIDAVDHALLELVRRRRDVVADTFEVKRRLGLPVVDPAREAELVAERRRFAEAMGVPGALAEALMRALMDDSHTRPEASEGEPAAGDTREGDGAG